MLYRFFRAVAELFPFVCFALFTAAFFTAFAFTVIYPIVPLLLLIVSIFALVLCVATSRVLRFFERTAALRRLRRDACPACAAALQRYRVAESDVAECTDCGRVFDADGSIWEPSPDVAVVAEPVSSSRTS
jgi:hypothetical protein